LLTDFKTGDQ